MVGGNQGGLDCGIETLERVGGENGIGNMGGLVYYLWHECEEKEIGRSRKRR
jgi:hypothetical protein